MTISLASADHSVTSGDGLTGEDGEDVGEAELGSADQLTFDRAVFNGRQASDDGVAISSELEAVGHGAVNGQSLADVGGDDACGQLHGEAEVLKVETPEAYLVVERRRH